MDSKEASEYLETYINNLKNFKTTGKNNLLADLDNCESQIRENFNKLKVQFSMQQEIEPDGSSSKCNNAGLNTTTTNTKRKRNFNQEETLQNKKSKYPTITYFNSFQNVKRDRDNSKTIKENPTADSSELTAKALYNSCTII